MTKIHDIRPRSAVLGAALALLACIPVQAAPFQLIYTGTFNNLDALNLASQSTPTFFTGNTPFTLTASFDTSSPNLAPSSPPAPPPFGGFRAYAPSLVQLTVGGTTFTVDSIATNPLAGVAVAVFDRNSFTPNRYGIGILQVPPQDGAGIVGDFAGASPDFTVNAITSTTFTNYYGVGHGSGVCIQGTGDNCQLNAVTPLVLHDSANRTFSLTLGNYDEDYPVLHDPANRLGPLNTARLVATPEPATFAMAGLTLALIGYLRRRRAFNQ